jgi:hypothetical protein
VFNVALKRDVLRLGIADAFQRPVNDDLLTARMSGEQFPESSEPLPPVLASGTFAQGFGKLQQLFVIALES